MRRLGTFSIVGRCERTGQLGVGVSTADMAAGRLVTWARAGAGAVATQSWPSLYLATRTFGSAILTFLAGLFLRLDDGWHGYDPSPVVD